MRVDEFNILSAEGANYAVTGVAIAGPTSFRALSAKEALTGFYLGRWPRLLHFAPLALRTGVLASLDRHLGISERSRMKAGISSVEDFDPTEWNIGREGREWNGEEFDKRIYQATEKIEYVGGIFIDERPRLTVLAVLLENLGIDKAVQLGKLEDWKAAIAEVATKEQE